MVDPLGATLRRERERRGITLEQVSKDLTISVRQLEALEEHDMNVFAASVYARGAYTSYARYLGLYDRQMQHAIERALSANKNRKPLRLLTPERFIERIINPRTIFFSGIVFLAAIVAAYILHQVQLFWQLPALEITSQIEAVTQQSTVMIHGKTEEEARVLVNEESVLLRDDASFEVEIPLRYGINILRIEAKNAAGRVRVEAYDILRVRDLPAGRQVLQN